MSSRSTSSRRSSRARHGTARLPSAAGYLDAPLVYSSLSFDLWAIPALSGRYVRQGRRLFELWSSNSKQLPFFPGERRESGNPLFHEEPTQRRFDGHTGKFDSLYVPQYFNPERAHWAFMRRPQLVTQADAAYDAYRPLTEVWLCHSGNLARGWLPAAFLDGLGTVLRRFSKEMEQLRAALDPASWDSRPNYASEARLSALGRMEEWSDTVDYGVAFQRGLREQEAWIAFAKERISKGPLGTAALREAARGAVAADDQYIGVWINGASEDVYYAYLGARVPCFIIHEFLMPNYTPTTVSPHPPTYDNFLEGTDVDLIVRRNAYEVAAQEEPRERESQFLGTDGRAREPRPARSPNRARSSSMHCSVLEAPPSSVAAVSGPAPSTTTSETSSMSRKSPPPASTPLLVKPTPMPPAPNAERNKYLAPEIQRKRVDPKRVEWVVPPPVAHARKASGRYELAEYNDETAWIYRGQKAKVSCASTWYDRDHGRRLHFGRYRAEEGVLDEEVFGAPVPRFPFIVIEGEVAKPQRASRWMYRSRSPARGDQGRRATTPPPTRLPWAPGCGPSPKGKSGEKGKGKRMSDSSGPDSDDGMGVDDAEPAPIVVDGVDSTLGAVGFEALARDALYRNGARPLAIIHARGRMWLRMEDAAAGQRALGGLRSLGPELRLSYQPNDNFDEETAYTTNIWLNSSEGVGFDETVSLEIRMASAPEGAAAIRVQAPNPSSAKEEPEVPAVPGLEDALADLSVDPEVLETFLATMAVPGHLLLRVSASPSPPPEVLMPRPHMMHLTGPSPPSPPLKPSPPPSPPVAPAATASSEGPKLPWSPPSAPRAMRRKLVDRLTGSSGPRMVPRPLLADRLTEPPVPLAQRLTNPLLATRIGNSPLRDRLGEPSTSSKRGWDEPDVRTTEEDEPPPKKKTRGLRSGKDEQKKRKSKAKRAAEKAGQTQEGDAGTVTAGSSQAVASGSNVRLEDLEEGEIDDSYWEDHYEQDG
ncbi:hypothetical protein DFH08DRAFT_949493 [Mycena albidolilacea]|uniref:Uncharacterized protein n=1 Tax=Mycena albidolilacea TaxID=1033008 RepID=A0AAD7F148_9AGAR|nr:hypothetical protein DFH08DRAFT_949493 [Mycena albidolilacea]